MTTCRRQGRVDRGSAAPALAAATLVCLLLLLPPALAAEYTVSPSGGNFTGIREAIIYAASGDTILVRSGIYNETVLIDKPLTVRGVDTGTGLPVIEPGPGGDGIEIAANGCTVTGLVVRNARFLSGIRVTSDRNTIAGVTLVACSEGILLAKADNNRIVGNTITLNTRSGLVLENSRSNLIEDNAVSGNQIGIIVDEYSPSNRIFYNNFMNTVNVVSKSATTAWVSETPQQYRYLGISRSGLMGNYWSDYERIDADGDGIGDSPYSIQIGVNRKAVLPINQNAADPAPLMDPTGYYHDRAVLPPATTAPPPVSEGTGPAAAETPLPAASADGPGPASPGPQEGAEAGPAALPPLLIPAFIGTGIAAGGLILIHRRGRAGSAEPAGDAGGSVPPTPPEEPPAPPLPETAVSGNRTLLPAEAGDPTPPSPPQSYFPRALESKYSDIRVIGRGGIAWVYRANRRADGRNVAIKIPISFDEPTGRCFLNEITVWETLHHPHIVEVSAVNILPVPFVEMEYVHGSLESVAKPLPVRQAVALVRGIADALAYAHSLNVIHRDIKPQNILVTEDLTPKITDWGMSKVMAADSRKSSIAGFSLSYAAPEQISPAEFGRTGVRTDIYQLGVLFYELVTGSIPFCGESIVAVGNAILRDPPVPPSVYNPGAAAVDAIILRCLEKDPARRYQSAGELLDALSGYRDGEGP